MQPSSSQRPQLTRLTFFCLCGILIGCAGAPKVKKPDLSEERFADVLDQLRQQKLRIRELTAELSEVRKQNEAKKPDKPAATPQSAPVLPVEKIIPPETDEDSEDQEGPLSDEGNPIADSSHEMMHWYYKGAHALKEKHYDEAVVSFREFLKTEPSHIYADRAEYLITESHFKNQDYGLAIVAANRLEADHPHSFRLPDAYYLRAMAYLKMGQKADATESLRELVKRFPDHPISNRASRELASLSTSVTHASAPLILEDRDN
jgi:TolA-binding protein